MTLEELTLELRKIFRFKYLTVRPTFYRNLREDSGLYCGDAIELWDKKPVFISDVGMWGFCLPDEKPTGRFGKEYMHPENLVSDLELGLSKTIEEMVKEGDFSEYEKCIAEAEQ